MLYIAGQIFNMQVFAGFTVFQQNIVTALYLFPFCIGCIFIGERTILHCGAVRVDVHIVTSLTILDVVLLCHLLVTFIGFPHTDVIYCPFFGPDIVVFARASVRVNVEDHSHVIVRCALNRVIEFIVIVEFQAVRRPVYRIDMKLVRGITRGKCRISNLPVV